MIWTRKTSNSWERAAEWIIKAEGGYINDPDDPGGETKYGISKRSYPTLDIRALTKEQAKEIYKRDYWRPLFCDQTEWPLALYLFDAGVNHGRTRALQFYRETEPDEEAFLTRRDVFYHAIVKKRPKSRKYLKGWLNRLADVRRFAHKEE